MIGYNRLRLATSPQVRGLSGRFPQVDQVPLEFEMYFDV